jgi:nucleotide-binding universal stress UspA family protein
VNKKIKTARDTHAVVVGVDESAAAKAALDWAARYARRVSQPLRAVHVLPSGPGVVAGAGLAPGVGAAGLMAITPAMMTEQATGPPPALPVVEDRYHRSRPEPTWTLHMIASTNIGAALLDQAINAELLVIGTGEHTGIGRLLSGSVSHYCLSHASIPIVAVPAAPSGD